MLSILSKRAIALLLDSKVFSEIDDRLLFGWIKALSPPRLEKTLFAPLSSMNASLSLRWSSLALGPKEAPGDAAISDMHLSLVTFASGCIDCALLRTLSMMSWRGMLLLAIISACW